jgi:hypothetical protein
VLTPVPVAVTVPVADPMAATPVFDDDQVPPDVEDESVEVFPIHNNSEPVIAPGKFTIVMVCIL